MGEEHQSADDAASARIDVSIPHPARVWDYWLGGKDNYAPDREVGDEIVKVIAGPPGQRPRRTVQPAGRR